MPRIPLTIVGDLLIIADTDNHRVVFFDTIQKRGVREITVFNNPVNVMPIYGIKR